MEENTFWALQRAQHVSEEADAAHFWWPSVSILIVISCWHCCLFFHCWAASGETWSGVRAASAWGPQRKAQQVLILSQGSTLLGPCNIGPGKIEVGAIWPISTIASEFRSFPGFTSYYRRFVEGWRLPCIGLWLSVVEPNPPRRLISIFPSVGAMSVTRALKHWKVSSPPHQCWLMQTSLFHSFWRSMQAMVAWTQSFLSLRQARWGR